MFFRSQCFACSDASVERKAAFSLPQSAPRPPPTTPRPPSPLPLRYSCDRLFSGWRLRGRGGGCGEGIALCWASKLCLGKVSKIHGTSGMFPRFLWPSGGRGVLMSEVRLSNPTRLQRPNRMGGGGGAKFKGQGEISQSMSSC